MEDSSTYDELKQSAQSAQKAVHTGKAVVSAAKKAASGRIAGAAAEVLKDENLRTVAAALVMLLVLVLVFVMYIFPMAVYEGIETVIAVAGDAFSAEYYAGNGGNLLKAVWSFTDTFFSGIWNTLKSAASGYADGGSFYSDVDGDVVNIADAPGDSTYEKVQATKEKYRARRDTILDSIKHQGTAAASARAYEEFCSVYDAERDEFNGFTWDVSGCHRELSDLQALKLMSLYAVMNDNDFAQTHLSDYLQWLGYSGGAPETMDVFGTEILIPGWTGTFMPQYLTDEAKTRSEEAAIAATREKSRFGVFKSAYKTAYRDEYAVYTRKFGAPALEMMVRAWVSPSMTCTCQTALRKLYRYSGTFTAEDYASSLELQRAAGQYSDPEEGIVVRRDYTETVCRYYRHEKGEYNPYYSDTAKQNWYASSHNGKRMPLRWQSTGYEILPFDQEYISLDIYERYKIVTYTGYICISPRSDDMILSLSGIISGRNSGDMSA